VKYKLVAPNIRRLAKRRTDIRPITHSYSDLRELIHHRRFETREQAKQEIFEYIEVFYNRQRKHLTLGYRTPTEFDQLHRKAA
jgi:putative transposase